MAAPAPRPLPPAPPGRRLAAWIYTGPLGHLWSTGADVVGLWVRWGFGRGREALLRGREKRR